MASIKRILVFCLLATLWISCGDSYSTYSTAYMAYFTCDTGITPYNVVTSPGVFISVRQSASSLKVTDQQGRESTLQMTDVQARSFCFGLGGLILGTPVMDNDSWNVYCYDLACPVCDKAKYRLSIDENGVALCSHCETSFDLNNNGYVLESQSKDQRPLYRYPVSCSGHSLTVRN